MLLDTNALSALAEDDAALIAVLRPDRPWYLASIVLGEYLFGLIASNRRRLLEQWLEDIQQSFTFLTPDEETAHLYASLRDVTTRAGYVIPYHDLWIGALAQQRNVPVVTRDAHFKKMPGVRCLGW